jgi:hypothetical protein
MWYVRVEFPEFHPQLSGEIKAARGDVDKYRQRMTKYEEEKGELLAAVRIEYLYGGYRL